MKNTKNPISEIRKSIYVHDIMSKEIYSIDEEQSIEDAAKIMSDKHISCIVALKNLKPIGMLTESDLIRKIIAKSKNPKKIKIKEVMTPRLITTTGSAPVEKASNIMKQNKIKRLIVVNENKCIIGIVTQTDIIKNFNKIYDNYRHLLWNSKVYFLIYPQMYLEIMN